jgi:protein-S-isoprenylcysteine O-methyltransferase Ste14
MVKLMADSSTLSTVASVISGVGVAILFFRIQQELMTRRENEPLSIPRADWLLIGATLVSLLLVILPLISLKSGSPLRTKLPPAACSVSAVLVAGYILSILAHYRLFFGGNRSRPVENPEPAERVLVWLTLGLTAVLFVAALIYD